ncbi:AraC family transcriptional regulator [Dictyobacter sp. S3.2.2.5]|uniref:AraC family transcriptional regulator n=1 Tax=Dictyobacter halimunensis TaxID=3026934 RepID=A0ABQ6G195_9CHLR|nr:AraC family transcriptional regulator [Dictyobacter sp. S3.2.2.5]
MRSRKQILHFDDINHSHEAMGFSGRTDLPDFHIYTLEETYPSTRKVMPPYTLRFYCLLLLEENSQDAVIELNTRRMEGPSNTISFQAPGHVSAWVRGEAQQGFLLYFQPEFLSRHVISPMEEFPFFRPTESSMLPLTGTEKIALRDHFLRLERTFKNSLHPYRVPMLQAMLLALLFDCKGLYEDYCARQPSSSRSPSLSTQFLRLLEQHYLTRRTVQAYADLLHVTPNHLSHAISNEMGRNAYDLIVDRLLLEAKKLLSYTDLSVGEVANYLGFEEPTHFTRLFKRKLALTPLEYRHQATRERA